MIYHCYLQTFDYLEREIKTSVEIVHANNLDFPAVTLCNMSPIKKSALMKSRYSNIFTNADELKETEKKKKKKRKKRGAYGKIIKL